MITLTELFCLNDEWSMWNDIQIVDEKGKLKSMSFNVALARYGDKLVDHFNRYTVYVRE